MRSLFVQFSLRLPFFLFHACVSNTDGPELDMLALKSGSSGDGHSLGLMIKL